MNENSSLTCICNTKYPKDKSPTLPKYEARRREGMTDWIISYFKLIIKQQIMRPRGLMAQIARQKTQD